MGIQPQQEQGPSTEAQRNMTEVPAAQGRRFNALLYFRSQSRVCTPCRYVSKTWKGKKGKGKGKGEEGESLTPPLNIHSLPIRFADAAPAYRRSRQPSTPLPYQQPAVTCVLATSRISIERSPLIAGIYCRVLYFQWVQNDPRIKHTDDTIQ